jgi:hypothetical protein
MFIDYIEKQAMLKFLMDNLEERRNRSGNLKSTEAELMNDSKIEILDDLIRYINRGQWNANLQKER